MGNTQAHAVWTDIPLDSDDDNALEFPAEGAPRTLDATEVARVLVKAINCAGEVLQHKRMNSHPFLLPCKHISLLPDFCIDCLMLDFLKSLQSVNVLSDEELKELLKSTWGGWFRYKGWKWLSFGLDPIEEMREALKN